MDNLEYLLIVMFIIEYPLKLFNKIMMIDLFIIAIFLL